MIAIGLRRCGFLKNVFRHNFLDYVFQNIISTICEYVLNPSDHRFELGGGVGAGDGAEVAGIAATVEDLLREDAFGEKGAESGDIRAVEHQFRV